ncbi:hypothetical protein A5881_003377 [Enterococcus termitis]|nr:hypothetical protein A5881_003470 [Enterococcus termitis]
MKVFFIFGPQAVGKMTIGERIAEHLKLPLLHNHMTLELLQPLFGWTPATFTLSKEFREAIFNKFVEEPTCNGLVFTFVLAFDMKEDIEEFNRYKAIFADQGINIYFVELEATIEERLYRNKTEYRLSKKASKRNVAHSEKELLLANEDHRLNSFPGEIDEKNYYRLDVTKLTAQQAADQIIKQFKLE